MKATCDLQFPRGSRIGGAMEPLTQADKMAQALAKAAYDRGEVRLTQASIAGCTHLVATRQGLFAVDQTASTRVAFGSFYGLTLRDGAIFAFEACDLAGLDTKLGRIVRLERSGDCVVAASVLATGLENGCHQIDFINGRLAVLDSQRQRVLLFEDGMAQAEAIYPLGPLPERAWSKGYAHINSLAQIGDRILLLLHNGAAYTGRRSEVAMFDLDWRDLGRWELPGTGCHNLVVLEDGEVLSCGSARGEIISFDRPLAKVTERMTRGLSADASSVVVGASKFSARRGRETTPGAVLFLDRDYQLRAMIELPAAPTEIRRLDGCDLGLSSYRNTLPRLLRTPG